MNKTSITRLARMVQKDPAMLEKVNTLARTISVDRHKRNTPDRRLLQAMTHEQLSTLCNTPPTTLRRYLDRYNLHGDVRVGSRLVFSAERAHKIREAVWNASLASEMAICAKTLEETHPEDAKEAWRLYSKHRKEAEDVLATIQKQEI